jgi:hypothetical protein
VSRGTQFANHNDVERSVERSGHSGGHHDTSPGQSENDGVGEAEAKQRVSKAATGILSICKHDLVSMATRTDRSKRKRSQTSRDS